MKNTAVVFPGQGSQFVGMANELLNEFGLVKRLFEEASDAARVDFKKLLAKGPEATLQLTENTQPSILLTSYAWFRVLEEEAGFAPGFGAGHSLGEYSALVAAKSISLSQGIGLVKERGRLMQEAVPLGKGAMAALIGLTDEQVEALCKEASMGSSKVEPANYNAPGQVVISGESEAVQRATTLAQTDGPFKARKAILLKVSAPFHSSMMSEMALKFKDALMEIDFQPLQFPLAFNVDGKVYDQGDVRDLLFRQVDHPVRWVHCVESLVAKQVERFVEPGPGKVLSGLIKRISKGVEIVSVESVKAVKDF